MLLNGSSNGVQWGTSWIGAPLMQPDMLFVYTTLLEVGAALCHLHSHYLVHCDVKPANSEFGVQCRAADAWCGFEQHGCLAFSQAVV